MTQDNFKDQTNLQEEDSIDIKKELGYYLFFWPWFVGTILLALVGSYLYLKTADRIYQASAQLQIKKGENDASSFLTGGIDVFGFNQVNVENDIAVLTSRHILNQVVARLDLQTSIYSVGRVNEVLRFNDNEINLFEIEANNKYQSWTIDVINEKATIKSLDTSYVITKGSDFIHKNISIKFNDSLFLANQTFKIKRVPLKDAVSRLLNALTAIPASQQGEIVNLNFTGLNQNRNQAILNTIMQVLAEDQVKDMREISKVSIDFIDERLKGLTKSIDTISQNTIAYQMASGIFDPATQTGNALSTIIKGQEEAFGIGIQLEIANALLEKLEKQASYQILPANIGIENQSVNTLLDSYNAVVTQRNNLLISTTAKSPMVLQLSSQLDNAKQAIVTGVYRFIESLQTSLDNFQQMEAKSRGLVAGLPSKENTLRGYARSFKIVEDLSVFLLERKEEASISYISALPNIKVLSYGVSSGSSISPKVQITYLAAILIGLIFPFSLLFLFKLLDTKINTRDDLTQGLKNISILGEMPFVEDTTLDDANGRGLVAESTRVVRSSLSFQLQNQKANVLLVTSTIKGEGKSFVSHNLAKSYTALGKKVIIVGADLRNPQLHKFLDQKRENIGLSTYLRDPTIDIDSLITKANTPGGLDYMLTGVIPPNPSELLMRSDMKTLIDILKQSYDYIIIDSAPLLLVSDTTPLLLLSDLVVFVARAQYSEKKTLPFIIDMQGRPNMPPFGMVLNGLVSGPMSGYRYGYKYRYSYGYSYNYGYGYGYGKDS